MQDLVDGVCEACRKGAPLATGEEIAAWMPQIPGWEILEVEGVNRLEKSYDFDDFAQALDFTNRVGELSEEHGHHPVLLLTWGRVTIWWWTHKIDGLHRNDFIMAAKTDRLQQA